MTKTSSSATQSRRLVLAIAIVAAIVFCPAAIGLVLPEQMTGESARPHSAFSFAQDAGTPDAALDEIEARLDGVASTVPVQFAEEAGLPSDARDVRVSDDGTVVGFAVDSEPDEAIASINEIMETKGWTAIDLGGIDGETYVKNEGPYAQVVMTATQVGGSTSVVMRCMCR